MKIYKVVIGYIQMEYQDTGEQLDVGKNFPIAPFNVIVDSKEVADYLISELGVKNYELVPQTKAPIYMTYELN